MKKGRHRRYEEARAVKRSIGDISDLQLGDVGYVTPEPCPECGAEPGLEHAAWCMHEALEAEDDEED